MKLDSRFLTHVTKGEHYIISTSDAQFKGIIKNNETAAFIVECLKSNTTELEIVNNILKEYTGVDEVTVKDDVANIINKLRSIGAIEE